MDVHVQISFEVNCGTTVSIDVGECVNGTTTRTGIEEHSWGRRFRVVHFDKMVPSGSFIRLRTRPNTPFTEVVNCGLGFEMEGAYPYASKLLRVIVDHKTIGDFVLPMNEIPFDTDIVFGIP